MQESYVQQLFGECGGRGNILYLPPYKCFRCDYSSPYFLLIVGSSGLLSIITHVYPEGYPHSRLALYQQGGNANNNNKNINKHHRSLLLQKSYLKKRSKYFTCRETQWCVVGSTPLLKDTFIHDFSVATSNASDTEIEQGKASLLQVTRRGLLIRDFQEGI